jgi:hypothetical protein
MILRPQKSDKVQTLLGLIYSAARVKRAVERMDFFMRD